MPRRTGIHLDGVPLHIVQRGHNREPCFFNEDDYGTYLHWLGKALAETGCVLHAYAIKGAGVGLFFIIGFGSRK